NSFKTNILNHPHLLQDSTINQIQNHNPQITQNLQNQTAQSEQNLEHKTIQNLNPNKHTQKLSTLTKTPFNLLITPSHKNPIIHPKNHSKLNLPQLNP
ncbi:hypothetical protein, partial [Staphylococcus aureus]|uniref:hypothetical protein n=1 Tax=Staphylococcus aureus TaxID=1280 RepID=UPI001C930DFB